VTDLIGGAKERDAIQLVTSTWLRKRGDGKLVGIVTHKQRLGCRQNYT
jgi:hypothetical protein